MKVDRGESLAPLEGERSQLAAEHHRPASLTTDNEAGVATSAPGRLDKEEAWRAALAQWEKEEAEERRLEEAERVTRAEYAARTTEDAGRAVDAARASTAADASSKEAGSNSALGTERARAIAENGDKRKASAGKARLPGAQCCSL